MKVCNVCKEPKAPSEFHARAAARDGRAYTCKACSAVRSRRWERDNRDRDNGRVRQQRRERLEELAGRPCPEFCEVCGNKSTDGKALHYDHDHVTGLFRGWLCNVCNLLLGRIKDNPVLLRALAEYLELHASHPVPRAECFVPRQVVRELPGALSPLAL